MIFLIFFVLLVQISVDENVLTFDTTSISTRLVPTCIWPEGVPKMDHKVEFFFAWWTIFGNFGLYGGKNQL